ncbi:MAG TPA: hypothetical protein VMU62_10835 [Acidobacteriaceae bacterium]|nr:hypothetical protein [Acidobacteriaceae bacterium]
MREDLTREDGVSCEAVQRAMRQQAVRGESIPEFTTAENEHLAACDACTEMLLTRMLDQKPEIVIPTGFAVRVRAQLPDSAKTVRAIPAYGLRTAVAVLLLLALASSVFAYSDPRLWTISNRLSFVLECIVTFEIGGIALWLGTRRSTR